MGSLSLKANANNISASRVYSDPSLVSGLHKHLEWGKMFTLNQQHQMIIYFIIFSIIYCLIIVHRQYIHTQYILQNIIFVFSDPMIISAIREPDTANRYPSPLPSHRDHSPRPETIILPFCPVSGGE